MSKKIFVVLIVVFSFLSFVAFRNAIPEAKNKEVMNSLAPYIPYRLEKRLGGLNIINTKTKEVEKPSNDVVFKRLDELEKKWGKKHLSLKNDKLSIYKDGKIIKTITLKNKKEIDFVHRFFGI